MGGGSLGAGVRMVVRPRTHGPVRSVPQLAFDAFPLIAVTNCWTPGRRERRRSRRPVSPVGAVVAVPLGPWVEFRRKRPVMVADGPGPLRGAAELCRWRTPSARSTSPTCWSCRSSSPRPTSRSRAAAGFTSRRWCSRRTCKLPRPTAHSRSTTWTAAMLGPGRSKRGHQSGLFGPVVTVAVDAVSYLPSRRWASARSRAMEPHPRRTESGPVARR